MAKTYQEVYDLSQQITKDVAQSPQAWMLYLDTASRMYRYSFQDQLLIHAQKPEATACATFALWNSRFNRVVKAGTRGIALIDQRSERPRLSYVFDVADTVKRIGGKNPYLWRIPAGNEADLVKRLAERFDQHPETLLLDEFLHYLSMDSMAEETANLVEELAERKAGSFLEELDTDNLKARFESLACASLEYVLFQRCGIFPGDYFEPEDFQFITEFNTSDSLTLLGETIAQSARETLTIIGQISKQMQQELRQEQAKQRESPEKSLDNQGTDDYYTLKHESEQQAPFEQGGQDYGSKAGIPRGTGRADVPEPDDSGRGENAGQVRKAPPEVPAGEQFPAGSDTVREGSVVEPPVGGGRTGPEDGGRSGGADGSPAGRERSAEGGESDALGAEDEQSDAVGPGDRPERPDLPVSEPAPQLNSDTATPDGSELSGVDVSPEVVDEFLRSGGNQRYGVLHIIAYHQLRGSDFPTMLRSEFCGDGKRDGGLGLIVDGEKYAAWYDNSGIHVAKGETIQMDNASLFTWEQAANRISSLLEHGLYQPEVVVRQAIDREFLEVAEQLWYLHQDYNSEHSFPFFMEEELFSGGFPGSTARIAEELKNLNRLREIRGKMDGFLTVYQEDKTLLHWHFHQPDALLKRMENLDNERRTYPMSSIATAQRTVFITEDEVTEAILRRGSATPDWRLATYSFMIQSHTTLEQAKHFKDQFGIMGYSHSISHADNSFLDYDGKGVSFRRGNVEYKLNWNQYSKRVQELVLSGRFLTQEDIDQIPGFEVRALAKRVVQFFRLRGAHSPLLNTYQNEDTTNRTAGMLEGSTELDRILDAMRLTLSELDEGNEQYQRLMDIYADVNAFKAGTFSLFTPAASMEAEAQKRGVTLFVQPGKKQLSREEMVYNLKEGNSIFLNGSRFEIAEIEGSLVTVRDASFPLLASHYTTDELDKLLRKDTRNDYLLVEQVVQEHSEATQDVVENPVPNVQTPLKEKQEESEQSEDKEPETERQREREANQQEEPASEPEQESEQQDEQDPLLTFQRYEQDEMEDEPEDEEEPPYEVVLAPTVELAGMLAIFSREEDDYIRDGDEIRGFETQEEAAAFIDALMNEPPALEDVHEPEPTPVPRQQKPVNFRITDDALGTGGPKAKFQRNLAAIELVHRLEREGRMATAEEQTVLAQYVGWGGIPQAFDERNPSWSEEYKKLQAELTPEEYAAARGSTLNAHYTSPTVIREMYAGLERMGFTGGNILDPAMGVGNFFGMIPETLAGSSRLYGVELDEITGKIAKQLYQQADIAITGFEKTDFSNDFFDVAIGNVPFGNYQVSDRAYDRHHFMIHDYFLAKSLDKVRPGGVLAVITSAGTLDKKDEVPRRYLAERATLLGAVRLPNNAFLANAGTSVVTDILFLQKRDAPTAEIPDWVHLGVNEAGFQCNRYFVDHPDMVLGEWTSESTQYGRQAATIKPIEGADLGQQLHEAIGKIEGTIQLTTQEVEDLDEEVATIPADPSVRNFSYTVVDDEVFYRENSVMRKVDLPAATMERIKGMVAIRDVTQRLINAQLWESSEGEIIALQQQLNAEYDRFTKKYGIISSNGNKRAFALDSSYCLLKSLEVLDDEGNLKRKADMFSKRTIKRAQTVDHVDTPSEALAVSIAEKAGVDVDYMAELMGQSAEELLPQLEGVIFQNPPTGKWLTADEYLSGNVREKLRIAQGFAESRPELQVNVEALKRVQPKDLTASEIDMRLGATWIKPEYITQFMGDIFQTPFYLLNRQIRAQYSKVSGSWNISGKNADTFRNVYATKVYGTNFVNGYRLLEDALNLRDTRIMEKVMVDGVEKTVINRKETMLAQQKQDAIREAFQSWIFKDPQRRADLVREYNERFNSVRPRQYDGSHITFSGMNPEITLREHQRNAVAHILYGGNTLLAHCVGAGKTYEMAAAAMESKRLGLCQKSLFVVPNHLVDVWCS